MRDALYAQILSKTFDSAWLYIGTNARLKSFCSQKTVIISTTPILAKTTWVPKSVTLTENVIQCLHKTVYGICNLNFEEMLTLTVSPKLMII